MVSTKVDLNHRRVSVARDLDDLARLLFPGNRNHQRVFVAVVVGLKWADGGLLPSLEPLADKHGFSRRVLETVRAKARRLGVVDHVSRFNARYGYREGWVLSNRFCSSLAGLADAWRDVRDRRGPGQREKDVDALRYL